VIKIKKYKMKLWDFDRSEQTKFCRICGSVGAHLQNTEVGYLCSECLTKLVALDSFKRR